MKYKVRSVDSPKDYEKVLNEMYEKGYKLVALVPPLSGWDNTQFIFEKSE